jgi:hypothetical protein
VRCGFFDQSCNLLGPGYIDRVTGAGDFDLMAVGALGIPAFEVGVDGSVCSRYQHPGWLAFPRSSGDNCLEVVGELGTCDRAMKAACAAGRSAAKYS